MGTIVHTIGTLIVVNGKLITPQSRVLLVVPTNLVNIQLPLMYVNLPMSNAPSELQLKFLASQVWYMIPMSIHVTGLISLWKNLAVIHLGFSEVLFALIKAN